MTLLGQHGWYWLVFSVCVVILVAVPVCAWLETREANRRWGYLDEAVPDTFPYDWARDGWDNLLTAEEWEESLGL